MVGLKLNRALNPLIFMVAGLVLMGLCLNIAIAQGEDSTHTYPTYISPQNSLGLIQNVQLEIIDKVEDQCWTNIETIRQSVRLEFEGNNIGVYEEEISEMSLFNPKFVISVIGGRSSGGSCVANINFINIFYENIYLGIDKEYTIGVNAVNLNNNNIIESPDNINSKCLARKELSDFSPL